MKVSAVSLTLALGLLLSPLAADAQPAGKVPRIGLLWAVSPPAAYVYFEAFQQGLRDLGWIEGQNIIIEHRYAEGKYDRLPGLAAELVRLKVDLIVAWSTPSALAAKNATGTIPIVFSVVGDPIGIGLVSSLARPGGNITGFSNLSVPLSAKQLELLKEAIPRVSRVAVLVNPDNPSLWLKETEGAARTLGLRIQTYEVRDPSGLSSAFSTMVRERVGALIVLADSMFWLHRTRIADLAAKSRLPAMYGFREHTEAGGLMAYGANILDLARRTATHVDKILKGAKPGDLPVEQPTKFELVINMKTAKALGLTIPQSMFIRADEVIQ